MKSSKTFVSVKPIIEDTFKKELSQAMEICSSNPIEGIKIAKNVYIKANENEENISKGKALNVMGFGYYVSKNYSKSLQHLNDALSIFQQKNHPYGIAESQIWIGLNYRDLGELDKALEIHLNSLALSKRNGYSFLEGRTYSTLGMIYFNMENNAKTIECFEKALAAPQNNKDITLSNLASTYIKMGEHKKALKYLLKAYDLNKPTDKLFYRAFILSNLVTVFGELGNYEEALNKIKELNQYKDSFKDTYFINQYHSCLIGIYIKCKLQKQNGFTTKIVAEIPIKHIIKELKNSINHTESLRIKANACIHLVNYYEQIKKWKKMAFYQGKLMEINKKKFEKEKIQATERMSILHEVAQKEQQIKIQQLELQKNEIELEKKKVLEEINQQLEEKVAKRTAKLTIQNQQLREFAFIVSHDLREPLCNIHGIIDLLVGDSQKEMEEEMKWLLNQMNGCVKSMNQLLKDLLQYTTLDQKIDESLNEKVDCLLLINQVKRSLKAEIAAINAIVEYKNMPVLQTSRHAIRLIFEHLLSNALKFHSKERVCEISIDCVELANYFQFSVSDNGIGIKQEQTEQIFRVFQRLEKKGPTSTGIGLAICKKAIQLIEGEIFLESKVGEGSTFYFTVPK